jgi:sugar phosphate isomerase/epimerase
MIQFGFLAGCTRHISEEINFAREHKFDFIQLWYDSKGLEIIARKSDEFKVLLDEKFPAIIHALLDIKELSFHSYPILDIAKQLHHKTVIIHPYSRDYSNRDAHKKLREIMENEYAQFIADGIDVFVENNCRSHPLLHSPQDIEYFFNSTCKFGFLLDVAHIDSYDHLGNLVKSRYPDMLHLADKHFGAEHEHLPFGQGELDFPLIFREYLSSFDGKIIFEITQSPEDILNSRQMIAEIAKSNRY